MKTRKTKAERKLETQLALARKQADAADKRALEADAERVQQAAADANSPDAKAYCAGSRLELTLTAVALAQMNGSDPNKLVADPWATFRAARAMLDHADQFLTREHVERLKASRQQDGMAARWQSRLDRDAAEAAAEISEATRKAEAIRAKNSIKGLKGAAKRKANKEAKEAAKPGNETG